MGELANKAVEVAHAWSKQHAAIESVTAIATDNGRLSFTATFVVPLPARFASSSETRRGVRPMEEVTFYFPPTFPHRAPVLRLRDDFCRDFPHINPSKTWVSPCVYEGDMSELLQQPRWFDGLLDQIADWLCKAASDDLMNMKQGWEPMRTDECRGMLIDDWQARQQVFEKRDLPLLCYVSYLQGDAEEYSAIVLQEVQGQPDRKFLRAGDTSSVSMFVTTPLGKTIDMYLPCRVSSLDDLAALGNSFGVDEFEKQIGKLHKRLNSLGRRVLFVVLAARRPVPLIGSPYTIEFISFALSWSMRTKKKKTRITYDVQVLSNLNRCTPKLLQRFSGIAPTKNRVCMIGCGSVGSKICMHLARGGQDRFVLIDDDVFMPHNNSRHTLVGQILGCKSRCLSAELKKMGVTAVPIVGDARANSHSIPSNAVVIDSTASLAVRNFLANSQPGATVINCALYSHGRRGVLCIEGLSHNPRVDDLVLFLLKNSLEERDLKNTLLENSLERQATGQGCGSATIIAPDSRISLMAAGIAARVQRHFMMPSQTGEVAVGRVGDSDMDVAWNVEPLGTTIAIQDAFGDGWEVRLLHGVEAEMRRVSELDRPDETGGALLGHVSYVNKVMTVVDLIPAPEDSVKKPGLFMLGTSGLKRAIRRVEDASNGVFTYLGTWHSHPHGGKQSDTDKDTLMTITFLRNYEPTVCLIWTPSGIAVVA